MEKFIWYLLFLTCASAGRIFYRGRGVGGNLGEPVTDNKNLPDEQWFTQRFDHFSYEDRTTWQQVSVKSIGMTSDLN